MAPNQPLHSRVNGKPLEFLSSKAIGEQQMPSSCFSRRDFVRVTGTLAGGSLLCETLGCKQPAASLSKKEAASQTSYELAAFCGCCSYP